MVLARGAALASANAQLGAPSTVAMPYVGPGALAESGPGELAYSAVAGDETGVLRESRADLGKRRSRKPLLAIVAALAIFVGGAVPLALASAFDIRPHVEQRPDIDKNVVAPATQAPAKPALPASPSPAAPSLSRSGLHAAGSVHPAQGPRSRLAAPPHRAGHPGSLRSSLAQDPNGPNKRNIGQLRELRGSLRRCAAN
jgi:hypothetical protein